MTESPIFCAVDTTDLARARALAENLQGAVGGLKLGLEFFGAHGPAGVESVLENAGLPLFLDLKFHDIPNTVAGAVRSILPLRPVLTTIHAAGGPAMIAAAAEAAQGGVDRPKILAVTVLTSLSDEDLAATGQIGPAAEQVLRLAKMARENGADGLVCSPKEVALLRAELDADTLLVVPGIRPAGAATGDQTRVMTPEEALAAGADYLVIGRPITGSDNPAAAAREIAGGLT